MAEEIGDPSRAADYVREKRKSGAAVTGFGHRVYRAEDPRARHMRAGVERLSREMGQPKWFEILQAVVEAMAPYARHGVNVNVDFYSGVVYHLLGVKRDLFVPIFAIGRVPGWVVQVLEQFENNILIRPLTLYNGPDARAYVGSDSAGIEPKQPRASQENFENLCPGRQISHAMRRSGPISRCGAGSFCYRIENSSLIHMRLCSGRRSADRREPAHKPDHRSARHGRGRTSKLCGRWEGGQSCVRSREDSHCFWRSR